MVAHTFDSAAMMQREVDPSEIETNLVGLHRELGPAMGLTAKREPVDNPRNPHAVERTEVPQAFL